VSNGVLGYLFEEVESHILTTHSPLEVTSRFVEGVTNNAFHGVDIDRNPNSMAYTIVCSCGRRWNISQIEVAQSDNLRRLNFNGSTYDAMIEFCRMINERYAQSRGRYENVYFRPPWDANDDTNMWIADQEQTKTKKKKKREPKLIDFDNAIDGLEI
jgi:hypothetical protein